MPETEKRNTIAQWAFDTRPVLTRFHLWLEDVEVDRAQPEPVSAHSFVPRGIARCLAITTAATSLGTRLFGQFGEGLGKDKHLYNQVKKAADAISAYSMSEGLWYLTRSLPENHAIMVCLGEGLMPKAGETPEMGANPLLGFGRVYARPEVARIVDGQIRRMLNDPSVGWTEFYDNLRHLGITVWGAAVDTLENTSRFAEGRDTGPMSIIHLFDSPLIVTRPYEAYFGCLTVPRHVAETAAKRSVMLDWVTPRRTLMEIIEATYPGIRHEHVHIWTLAGKSRVDRLGKLWAEWKALGAHLVEDGWKAPTGLPVFTDSGTYAPTSLVRSWQDEAGATHVFLCDGYAATAEAMQAASLSEVLEIDSTMTVLSPTFHHAYDEEYKLMKLAEGSADFAQTMGTIMSPSDVTPEIVAGYKAAIREANQANIPLGRRVLRADDFLPEKHWRVLAAVGYMCDDPYTGSPGVEKLAEDRYRVTTRLATHAASAIIRFTFRLKDPLAEARLVFSPLLVRFMSGVDWTNRPVKISDSGRIRNELQTIISQAIEYEGDKMRVHFDRIDEKVMSRDKQAIVRRVLQWYKLNHPVWFHWLEIAGDMMEQVTGFDFVIVGSGFGGSVSALRLAEKGYKVAVLEAGKRFSADDFPKTNWDARRFLWAPKLFCYGIQRINLLRDVLILSGAGVGGGSLVYANTLPVPRDEVFARPEWPTGADWQKELAPHYATAQKMLGANTNPRVTRADQVMKECAAEIGKGDTWHPTEVSVFFGESGKTVPDPYFGGRGPDRAGCTFCGGCMIGCRHNAKNTLDRNYLYLAEKLGVQVFPETTIDHIEPLPEGGYLLRSYCTTALAKGGRKEWRAPNVILSAGVLGSVRLLLEARDQGTLPSLSPALGLRVRTNSEALVGATAYGSDVDYTDGIAITSSIYPDEVTHIEPCHYSRGSDMMALLAMPLVDGGPGVPRQLKFFYNCLRHPIAFLRALWPFGWAAKTIILLVMQTSDNHLKLVRKRLWWWPFGHSLTSEPSDKTEKRNPTYIPVANDMARRVAKRMGGWPGSALNEVLLDVPTTAHILGGAAIGSSADTAVCDAQHRVFNYPGLYVIDGSSVPVNLGVNPSLTITAMAEHAMSKIEGQDPLRN